jgi:hypothetical protein
LGEYCHAGTNQSLQMRWMRREGFFFDDGSRAMRFVSLNTA